MLLGSQLAPLQAWKPTAHGDNFWLDMIPKIAQNIEKVFIATIIDGSSHNACPLPVISALPFDTNNKKLWWNLEPNYVVKTILFPMVSVWLNKYVKKYDIDIIHLVGSFGPIQILLSKIKAARSIVQTQYDSRFYFYDQFLRISLIPFDAVITGSQCLEKKFRELNINPRILETIPWAVNVPSTFKDPAKEMLTRARLGLKSDSKVILWSGFISTVVTETEFLFSIKVAKKLLEREPDLEFVFTFKREDFNREYKQFEKGKIRIVPLKSRTEFLEVVKISNLLFSPCFNERAIICPPLTWLECMAHEVPVVTTNVRGVEELISNGKNGIILSDRNEALEVMSQLLTEPQKIEKLGTNAKKTIMDRFEIDIAVSKYLKLWSSLSE